MAQDESRKDQAAAAPVDICLLTDAMQQRYGEFCVTSDPDQMSSWTLVAIVQERKERQQQWRDGYTARHIREVVTLTKYVFGKPRDQVIANAHLAAAAARDETTRKGEQLQELQRAHEKLQKAHDALAKQHKALEQQHDALEQQHDGCRKRALEDHKKHRALEQDLAKVYEVIGSARYNEIVGK